MYYLHKDYVDLTLTNDVKGMFFSNEEYYKHIIQVAEYFKQILGINSAKL